MKKYSTSYLLWTIWFISYLFILTVLFYAAYKGFTYDGKYLIDFTGYILMIAALVSAGLMSWEMVMLIDFLIKGVTGNIYWDETCLKISSKNGEETFRFEDLKAVEFVSKKARTRSIIGSISYCKLIFSGRTLFLTSLTIDNEEIAKNLGIKKVNVLTRERNHFELMR